MDEQTLTAIVSEDVSPSIVNRSVGRIFQLSRLSVAIDFHLSDDRYLFVSVEPQQPRLYLIVREPRQLNRQALAPSSFALTARKHFAGARLRRVRKEPHDRIVSFDFDGVDAAGDDRALSLVAQLTGRSAELFALDEEQLILATLRGVDRNQEGALEARRYAPPLPRADDDAATTKPRSAAPFARSGFDTLSAAADHYYLALADEKAYRARAAAKLSRARGELAKKNKLRAALARDRAAHGDAEQHRRVGDLLLANASTARRSPGKVELIDYFAEDAPTIEVAVDDNLSLPEEAARRFQSYGKSKRAAQEIDRRADELRGEIAALEDQIRDAEGALAAGDRAFFPEDTTEKDEATTAIAAAARKRAQSRRDEQLSGLRRFRSSDDYEILVGRGAQDNDRLTFRVARAHDVWLHSADYPGAHVVVVNHDRRREVPHRTIVEAAQLAAHFSQARSDAKVNVHYTQRKYLSKPKASAPGQVRLSNFRTMLVEPRALERMKDEG